VLQLSRLELYKWILKYEEQKLYEDQVDYYLSYLLGVYRKEFFDAIRFNIKILEDIEEWFVSDKEYIKEELWTIEQFRYVYERNIKEFSRNLQHFEVDISEFSSELSKCKDSYSAFNKLIKQLEIANSKILKSYYRK